MIATPRLEQDGYELVPSVFSGEQVTDLLRAIEPKTEGSNAGTRRLLEIEDVKRVACHPVLLQVVSNAIGGNPFPVRAILFDKHPDANWDLGFHQDRAIAVKARVEADGFHGWSVKEGVPHVLPPASALENMVSARIHLDDCGPDNGPLRVSPGTHSMGIFDKTQVQALVQERGAVMCTCEAGDVLFMRPLLLHASSKAANPSHRRVVHIEYASQPLSGGLEWYEA